MFFCGYQRVMFPKILMRKLHAVQLPAILARQYRVSRIYDYNSNNVNHHSKPRLQLDMCKYFLLRDHSSVENLKWMCTKWLLNWCLRVKIFVMVPTSKIVCEKYKIRTSYSLFRGAGMLNTSITICLYSIQIRLICLTVTFFNRIKE